MKKVITKRQFSNAHHGEIIELAIRRSDISISQLCMRLGISRRCMYNWFAKSYLDPRIIRHIGLILNYDFSKELPELEFQKIDFVGEVDTYELTRYPDSASYWRDKYLNLLDTHHILFVRT